MIAEGEVMQLAAAKNTATTEDEYLAVIRAKTAELFAAACEVGPVLADRPKAEQAACRSFGMNLGIAFQLVDDVLDYGGAAAKLGKNVGDDFREGKITLPVVLAFRRGSDAEREFWRRTLERGEATDADLEHAIGLMTKHRALEDTIGRAHHYGAIARDALALFPESPMKSALAETVDFCIAPRRISRVAAPLWTSCQPPPNVVAFTHQSGCLPDSDLRRCRRFVGVVENSQSRSRPSPTCAQAGIRQARATPRELRRSTGAARSRRFQIVRLRRQKSHKLVARR